MIKNLYTGEFENLSIGWIRVSQAGEVILNLPVTAGRVFEKGVYAFECLVPPGTIRKPPPREDLTVSVDVSDNRGDCRWLLGVLATKEESPSGETLCLWFADHRVEDEFREFHLNPGDEHAMERLVAAAKKAGVC